MEDLFYKETHFLSVKAEVDIHYIPVSRLWGTVNEGWIFPNWQFIESTEFRYGRLSIPDGECGVFI